VFRGDAVGPTLGPALLYRSVQDSVKRYIVERGLAAGDALPPETHLARDLGISRNSVREAVKALESLGVLEVRPGKGLYVRSFSLDPILDNLAYSILSDRNSIEELMEVRRYLEVSLLPRAIPALTPDKLAALRRLVQGMAEKAARGKAFPEEDRLFHRTLAEATGNTLLVKLLDVFWTVFSRLRDTSITVNPAPEHTRRTHARVLEAIEAHDVPAAQAAMVESFGDLEERIRNARLNANRAASTRRRTEGPPAEGPPAS
jgi:DNA-binding FadR family transcriptional regulator